MQTNSKTIKDLLDADYQYTEIILQYLLDMTRSQIFLNQNLELSDDVWNRFLDIQRDLKDGRPLQYAIGKWNFYGYDFSVNENVLIPRPETELLVEEILKENLRDKKLLDIGTGSGAIAISLALENNVNLHVSACDISREALEVARMNAKSLGALVDFIHSDLFENVEGKFDIIVSNPPYISEEDYDELDKLLYYEPKTALYGGVKGYEIYEKIINQAKSHLADDASIFFEIGYDQGKVVSDLLKENGYHDVKILQDYGGKDRIVKGKWLKDSIRS
ncbi:peptide chain release factor N(5)-glutamine methyltransferase [uncultured Helcococcus sp.]|uniref:peptide chain release factor N(5)-glutamine methyltransferase n=1 Tax=uncultured Helcococcus sp. TaxID=1072508 RepID=UPI0026327F3B|nr:peptide chain release factor N(5)-glutamine methyltransferase [uncultured Helcococcus sp.]